jgi:hypothetical protein
MTKYFQLKIKFLLRFQTNKKCSGCNCNYKPVESKPGLFSGFRDFEDALQYHCALAANCDIIVTRNVKDFKKAEIPVITPDEYLRILNNL